MNKFLSFASLAPLLCIHHEATAADVFSMKLGRIQSRAQVNQIDEAIQKVAKPVTVKRRNKTVEQLLIEHCGEVRPAILKAATEMNPDPSSETLEVPPCSYWKEQATVVVPLGSSVATTVTRWTGEIDPARALASTNLGNLGSVSAGQKIQVRGLVREQRLSIADGVTQEQLRTALSAHVGTLCDSTAGLCAPSDVAGGDRSTVAVTPLEANAVEPVPVETDLPLPDQESCATESTDWPIPKTVIAELARDRRYRTESASGVIVIADTGVPETTVSRLPILVITDPNRRDRRTIGKSLALVRGFEEPYSPDSKRYAQAAHGIAVASVAAGLSIFQSPEEASYWTRLRIYSIMGSVANAVWGDPGGIRSAVDQAPADVASTKRIPIVNISWEYARIDPDFLATLQKSSALVVVAAGNGAGKDLDTDYSYPAVYSNQPNLITVAAIRPDLQLASFSSQGANSVTIAAPGCMIPALDESGQTVMANGTSVAAPIVAFTAAIVQSLGVTQAWQIKARLQAAADVDSTLDVEGGRRLNVLDSISVRDDIVYLKAGSERLTGRLSPALKFRNSTTGSSISPATIMRISNFQSSDSGWVADAAWLNSAQSKMLGSRVKITGALVLRTGDGVDKAIGWNEVALVIPRMVTDTTL